MKLLSILPLAVSLLLSSVSAINEDSQSSFMPTAEKPFEFRVQYLIQGKQEDPTSTEVVPLENGEEFKIEYSFRNDESEEVSIVGLGGSFNHPVDGSIVTNLTTSQLGPLVVQPGESTSFIQKVGLDLNADSYVLAPAIYVVYQSKLMLLGSRNQIVTVSDAEISIFNPQLLFLELVLLSTLGGLAYFAYIIFGKKYIQGTAPVTKRKVSPPPKAVKSKSTGSKGYDENWLPDNLRKAANKSKK